MFELDVSRKQKISVKLKKHLDANEWIDEESENHNENVSVKR